MEAKVQGFIDDNKVMVFSKDYCPFCTKAKSLLDSKGIEYEVVELDLIPDGKEMHAALKSISNKNMQLIPKGTSLWQTYSPRTVPCIYINGELVGGCDDLYAASDSGKLKNLLVHERHEADRRAQIAENKEDKKPEYDYS